MIKTINAYMDTISGSEIQSPICFVCACKFSYVSAREVNDIKWVKPSTTVSKEDKRIKHFLQKEHHDVEHMFGLQTYLENYATIQKGKVHLGGETCREDFDDWLMTTPSAVGDGRQTLDVEILCCPEDKTLHQCRMYC